jgi:urease accessory protein
MENDQKMGVTGLTPIDPVASGLETDRSLAAQIEPFLGQRLNSLLFLASPSLPTGAFAWSSGLEAAAAYQTVTGSDDLTEHLEALLAGTLATFDLPLMRLAYAAVQKADEKGLRAVNLEVLAGRETKELLLGERAMGRAVGRLIKSLGPPPFWNQEDLGFIVSYALLGYVIDPHLTFKDLARAYVYGFLENQLAAASRVIPLGQTSGRKIILALNPKIDQALLTAETLPIDLIGSKLLGLAIFSSNHETLETRLFRS